MEKLQLCTNETLIKLLKIQREQIKTLKNAFIITIIILFLNIIALAGGILYFLDKHTVVIIDNTKVEDIQIN